MLISGLPGSGKTTLGRALAGALALEFIDKDEILEALFDAKGCGDAQRRRELSRESDRLFEAQARGSKGAVLVSHWRFPGMPAESGTLVDWVCQIGNPIVNVHCACDPDTAAQRFRSRNRHPGHLDAERSPDEVVRSIRAIAPESDLGIRPRVEVDTTRDWDLAAIARRIRIALA